MRAVVGGMVGVVIKSNICFILGASWWGERGIRRSDGRC